MTGWVKFGYAWQAVFRITHIWAHPVLAKYKYMFWVDDDALPSKTWLKDPLKPMVKEDLVILHDNFPQGSCHSPGILEEMNLVYNYSVCDIGETKNGTLIKKPCEPNGKGGIKLHLKLSELHGCQSVLQFTGSFSPHAGWIEQISKKQ